jgi:acetyl/propionyl-CoA carboxylase alpha subunit
MKIKSSVNSQSIDFNADDKNPLLMNGGVDDSLRIIDKISDHHLIVERKNRKFEVRLLTLDAEKKIAQIKVDGHRFEVKQEDEYDILLRTLGMGVGVVKKVNDMKAPMPGVVLDIKVTSGQVIKKDDPIVVLEAMKMENLLKSPIDGVIKGISIAKGETVEKNRVLVTFE